MRGSRTIIFTSLLAMHFGLSAEDRRILPRVGDADSQRQRPGLADGQIGRIEITGNHQISDAAFAALTDTYLGRSVSPDALARLTRAIVERASDLGYPFARAMLIDDGARSGEVRIALDEGWIGAVRIEGAQDRLAVRLLEPLAGRPAFGREVSRHLAEVGKLPGREVVDARLEGTGADAVLVVRLARPAGSVVMPAAPEGSIPNLPAWTDAGMTNVAAPASAGPTPQRQIGAVIVSSSQRIDSSIFHPVTESYFGKVLSEETLARLTGEIADAAREQGHRFARTALVNDGEIGGIIEIRVDEGRVDAVRIEGYENARARQMLEKLVGGSAAGPEFERQIALVRDLPAVSFRGARLEDQGDRSVLVVRLERREDYIRIEADNYGSETYGPIRARAALRGRAVFDASDELELAVRTNPLEPEEFQYFSGYYDTQLASGGTRARVAMAFGDSVPGGQFEGFEIAGNSIRLEMAASHPLVRRNDMQVDLEADISALRIKQEDLSAILRDDTVVTASLGVFAQVNPGDSRVRARLSYVRGLDLLGATRPGDPLSSRSDGDGVFSALHFWADAGIPLVGDIAAYVAVRGQLADRPLLSSEEFALGGAYRLRGYDFREVAGDSGVHAHAELRYTVPRDATPIDFLQFYGFVEGGEVWDIASSVGEGSLFSAGPGLRARIGRFDFEVEGGFPLGGTGEQTPDKDPEVNVRAGLNF